MQQEKSPEDEAFEAITQRQMKKETGDEEGDNALLERIAKEFDKMHVFGDTAASFAAYVRAMKK